MRVSTDGGATFSPERAAPDSTFTPTNGPALFEPRAVSATRIAYAVVPQAAAQRELFVSDDRGTTWRSVRGPEPYAGELRFCKLGFGFPSASWGYLTSVQGTAVFVSDNGGSTWIERAIG